MIKGYKVFDKNLQCRGFQFEVGKNYEEEEAVLCKKGFHFHENSNDLFNYYDFNSDNIVCEVECEEVVTGGDKSVCKRMKVVRQLDWVEVLNLINTGKQNTGRNNSGDGNSGDGNSGYGNSGDGNSGCGNSRNGNSGNGNSGDGNSGNKNSGNWNSGNGNSGDGNSGNKNSGYRNSGNGNSGYRNSGDGNSGCGNSRNGNSGNGNSGNGNSGNGNSGNGNSCNHSSGFLNSKEQTVFCLNKDVGFTREEFNFPEFYLELVYEENGQYKERNYKEAWKKWCNENPQWLEKVKALRDINGDLIFDADVFEEITGVRVD